MTIKSMVMVGALCLSTVSLVSAKSYEFQLSSAVMAGDVQIPAGTYKVTVDGNNAVLKNEDSAKTYTAPVKVETQNAKHGQTAVVTNDSNGQTKIKEIELGGSTTNLEFGE